MSVDIHRPQSLVVDADHPWPGLVSFTEDAAAFFFGREQEVAELARLIRLETLTVLFGKSGLGKSSILRAGVAPALRPEGFLPIFIRLDHADSAPPLEAQVKARIGEAIAAGDIDATPAGADETLWEFFHQKGRDWWNDENQLLTPILVFDQFEELLTGHDTSARAARTSAFLVQLEDLVENRPPSQLQKRFASEAGLARQYDLERVPYRVVLALREDFLADLEGLHARLRAIMTNRFRLLPMSGEQAMQVILKPGHHLVSEDVALQITDFVSASQRSRLQAHLTRAQISHRQVEPALLSVVLQELNNHRLQSASATITADLVGDGQAAEILEHFFERGLTGMDDSVRDFIVDALLTSSGARNRVAEEDALTRYGMSPAVIEALIDRRIIQRQSSGDVKWLELTHDTLADVVRADRTDRAKRREVAAAAAREADVRRRLARTHRLIAVFAVLLLIAGLGLGVAYKKQRELTVKQRQLEATQAQEQLARADVSAKGAQLSQRDLQIRQQSLREVTDIVGQLRKEVELPTPGGAARVRGYFDHLANVSKDIRGADVSRVHAEAFAVGAQVFYDNGLISEGLTHARHSQHVIDALAPSAFPESVTRAQAHYVVGKGLLETGHLDEAETTFAAALAFLGDVAAAAPTSEPRRLMFQSQLGMAEVKRRRGDLTGAKRLFGGVLSMAEADARRSHAAELSYWRGLSLQGLGLSEDDDAIATPYFRRAADELARMTHDEPHNLRWRRLAIELAYDLSFSQMDVARFAETEARLEAALDDVETQAKRDEQNLDWAYLQALVNRDLGQFYQKRVELRDRAHERFQQTRILSQRVMQTEPAWSQNLYLYGVSLWYLAETAPPDARKAPMYRQAAEQLETLVHGAPGHPRYIRAVSLALNAVAGAEAEEHKLPAAMATLQRSLALMQTIPPGHRARFNSDIAWIHEQQAKLVLRPTHRAQDAAAAYKRAYDLRAALARREPTVPHLLDLAFDLSARGDTYLEVSDLGSAAESYKECMAALDRALARFPADVRVLKAKAEYSRWLSRQWRQARVFDSSLDGLREAAGAAKKAFELDPINQDLYKLAKGIHDDSVSFENAVRSGTWVPSGPASPAADLADRVHRLGVAEPQLRPSEARAPSTGTILQVDTPQGWPMAPLVPGNWRTLPRAELQAEARRTVTLDIGQKLQESQIIRIRTLPLSFYDNAVFYEAEVRRGNGGTGIVSYVRAGKNVLMLNGRSNRIHDFNRLNTLRLDTSSHAAAYLNFFTAGIFGDEGTFRIVESAADVPFASVATGVQRSQIARLVSPLQMSDETPDGKWNARGMIHYSNALFYALFQIGPTGAVDMVGDEPAATDQPLMTERFVDGVRILTDFDFRRAELRARAQETFNAKRQAEAVAAQQKVLDFDRGSDALGNEERSKFLVGDYVRLSWYQLHARDFAGALASAQAGERLDQRSLSIQANSAHALLFLGRTDEAEVRYRKFLGQKVSASRTWEQTILDDIRAMQEAGLVHAGFPKIQSLMTGSGGK